MLQGAQLHMPQELHDQSSIYWISPTATSARGSALGISDLSAGFGSALTPPSSSGSGGGFSGAEAAAEAAEAEAAPGRQLGERGLAKDRTRGAPWGRW